MIKELLYKWLGMEPFPCSSCEILRSQLEKTDAERRELLHKLLVHSEPPTPQPTEVKDFQPVRGYTPWRVRQQILEAEDRKKAQLLKKNAEEIAELEKELNVGTTGE